VVGTALAVGAVFLVAVLVIDHLARSARYHELDASLLEEAHSLTALVEQTNDDIETDLHRGASTLPAYELWAEDGEDVDRSPRLGERHLDRSAPRDAVVPSELPGGAAHQATTASAPRQDEELPPAPPKRFVLAVARPIAPVEASLASLRAVLIGVGLAAIALCVLVLAWVTHR